MSWLLADMKKKMNEAKSTLEQSFKQVAETEKQPAPQEETKPVESEEKLENEQKSENENTESEAQPQPEPQTPSESAAETAKKSMAALFGGLKVGSGVASNKLYEYAKYSGKKLGEVKNAVIENTMLGDLNKTQDEFEKQLAEEREKLKNIDMPWEGLPDETLAKKQMLSLSMDTRTFLRDSPASSEYSYEQQQAMATRLLKEDPNLANVRFQLVPKQVKENQFWQNYFYRIGLIRQSMIGQTTGRTTPTPVTVTEAPAEASAVAEPVAEVRTEVAAEVPTETQSVEKSVEKPVEEELEVDVTQSSESEEEEKEAVVEQPAAPEEQTITSVDEEWEREILADLNDYDDVVEKTGGKDDDAWEAEIQELLQAE